VVGSSDGTGSESEQTAEQAVGNGAGGGGGGGTSSVRDKAWLSSVCVGSC